MRRRYKSAAGRSQSCFTGGENSGNQSSGKKTEGKEEKEDLWFISGIKGGKRKMSFGYMESEHRNSGKLFIQLYDALRKKMCGKGHKLAKNRE